MRIFRDNSYAVMLDIDGTLKDLVKENTDALIKTMQSMNRIDIKFRGKCVLLINRLNMYFIKTGLLPTNKFMQNFLLLIYSCLLFKKYYLFKEIYFKNYNKENVWFRGVESKIEEIYNRNIPIYLVTKNAQNKNIENSFETNFIMRFISKIVLDKNQRSKYYLYKDLIGNLGIANDKLLVIGDNFWDDIVPALVLNINVVWCDMYNCKIKKIAIFLLKLLNKNVIS